MPNTVAQTFSEYRERLLKFIRSRVRALEDAEDILQDVFYQYANVNSIISPIENTSAWLYKVARNRIIDQHKKKKDEPLPAQYDEDEDDYIVDEIADIIYGEETTPETEMFRALFLEEIQTALSELPKEQREVFEMTEFLDFSVKEVAEKTKTPVNTVLSRKHYAVRHLRNRLKELYNSLVTDNI
ncbi:MAG: sigma-70 family RNA polymerase sigma factor [Treponema sp.]|jgi:RNA polymerase sigma factor (sigma-70 family)|nr:sigma-70 family RNA polymerase sigma factor [Treponema sp.]